MHPIEQIAARIRAIRGQRVILDADLAALYGVETRRLNEQVRRNPARFPSEFMFQLTDQELGHLMSQIAISKPGRGGLRKRPLAFTEHGALMAATLLNSAGAIQVSLLVIRAFVAMRRAVRADVALRRRLDELERKVGTHDRTIAQIFNALRQLTAPPEPQKRRRIGFL